MKLSAIYSNKESVFPRIAFREGFNVVFARINDPDNLEKDSHNLGKTFLIDVIEFGLLKQVGSNHPFRKRDDLFGDFTFFLEIENHDGSYITVRRNVSGHNPVCVNVNSKGNNDLRDLSTTAWTHPDLSFAESRRVLDSLLSLSVVKPYTYRKGVGYFLRRQKDYGDVFRLAKFARGKDVDWKPFLARLLGFNHDPIAKKYNLEQDLEAARARLAEAEEEAASGSGEYDELRALISVRSDETERMRRQVESFSFKDLEEDISETLVNDIEGSIAYLNERRYILDVELREINRSLQSSYDFDVDSVQQLYAEVGLVWPDALARQYDDLIEFNRRIASARTDRLRELATDRREELEAIDRRLSDLDSRRQEALSALRQKETLEKYRQVQHSLVQKERELIELQQRLATLDAASGHETVIRELRSDIDEESDKIQKMVKSSNATFDSLRRHFTSFVERVFGVKAILYVLLNNAGNVEFRVRTVADGTVDKETFEGEGTSYKKMLCACFDLALLVEYANAPFYHFAYHDGIFESLDDRKKVTLIATVKDICQDKGIQYILTVMDSDLPRDPEKQSLLFSQDEIIRLLHDDGVDGRLFRMETF